MLESNAWQSVPGCPRVRIYPMLRAPSILCSNAYLIDAPETVLIIDPGGEAQQARALCRLAQDLVKAKPRPVQIMFTHCHIDHVAGMREFMRLGFGRHVICHARAAEILASGDGHMTSADLYGWEAPKLRARELIFRGNPAIGGVERVPLGQKAILEAHHTPGHSPESVCYQLGELFIVGDLPFATTPGVAGLAGWDQAALVDSLEFALERVESGAVTRVLPGHGRVLAPDRAAKVLRHGMNRAAGLQDLARIDHARVEELQSYAGVLLDEASRAFAGIGGQLLRQSHYLETLGETEAAQRALAALDVEEMERAVSEFHAFAATFDTVHGPRGVERLQLLAKAVQFAERGQRLLAPFQDQDCSAPRLARRTQRLLTDFVNQAQGVRFEAQEEFVDLRQILSETLQTLRKEATEHEATSAAFYEAANEQEEFCAVLTRRLARLSLFGRMRFELVADEPAPPLWAPLEIDAFQDVLTAVLELYAIAGRELVRIKLKALPDKARIGFSSDARLNIAPEKAAYFRFALQRFAGDCIIPNEGADLVMELQLAGGAE